MGALDGLFETIKEVSLPPRRKRIGDPGDGISIALIANNGGDGCILEYDGFGIEASIEDTSKRLDDNGLDDAPDGLSIWEGHYRTWEVHTPDRHEYEAELQGTFRDLSDREWTLLRETGVPWEFEDDGSESSSKAGE